MSASSDDLAALDELAEEFVDRIRRGERPTIQSYTARRPSLAADIQRLFPTLVAIEGASSSAATAVSRVAVSATPERIGDYRVLRQIGEGGMGVVYEAIQESLGRHVALKVLPRSAHQSERQRERFRVEARAAARLHHPHIVPVFGVGDHDGIMYYAMQFITGRGLDELLRPRDQPASRHAETVTLAAPADTAVVAAEATKGPVALATRPDQIQWAARVAAQVAGALAYAHVEGVIHRDIKPSNLILDDRGNVWVTDFGLAKTKDAGGLTEPGDIVGTIRYMAPERFSGWSDVRSDVYGLGATLFELLTQRPMYDEPDRGKLIHAILHAEPPRPRKFNRAMPRDLETIVLKSTAREPSLRYQSAEEMAADLTRFNEGRPILARRQTVLGYVWSWCKRKPVAAGMATAVVVLLLVLLTGSLLVNVRLDNQNRQIGDQNQKITLTQSALEQQLAETSEARRREATANIDARRQLMLALRREAQAARHSRQPGSRQEALKAIEHLMELARELPLTADETLEVRNLVIAIAALLDVSPVPDSPRLEGNVTFSPDLRHYTIVRGRDVIVREYPSERVRARLTVNRLNSYQFSPDGKHLIVGCGQLDNAKHGGYLIWNWHSNEVVATIPAPIVHSSFAINRSGDRMASVKVDGTIDVYSLPDARIVRTIAVGHQVQKVVFAPDSQRLALYRNGSQVEVWNINDGKLQMRLATPTGAGVMGLAWSPNGQMIAAGCANYRSYVWHVANGQLAADLVGHQAEVTTLFFDPHCEWIATSGWDSTTRFWNPVTGTPLLTLRGAAHHVSGDGRTFAHYSGQNWQTYQIHGRSEFHSLHRHLGAKGPWHASFSKDGRVLATSGHDGIEFWDADTGRHAGSLRPHGGALSALFHPEGGHLITAGRTHLSRWPVAMDKATNVLEIGTEEPLLSHQADTTNRADRKLSMSRDGNRVAVSNQLRQSVYVFSFNEPNLWRSIAAFPNLSGIVMSPDGKWIFGESWPNSRGRVWNASTGFQVKDLRQSTSAFVAFSPDGSRMAYANNQAGEILEVETWKRLAVIPPEKTGLKSSALAYSPNGEILAVVRGNNVIQLLDARTLLEVARLEAPDTQGLAYIEFSPDGGCLAAVATTHVVQLWNLRRLRTRLADLNLDWDHPRPGLAELPERAVQVRVLGK